MAPPSASAASARKRITARTATASTWIPPAAGTHLNFGQPRVVQLVLDSLRYWVDEFHIDGFRFDLAVTLCRNADNEFDPRHPFLVAVAADPVLSDVKLISEPWDVGYGGWQTGRFPGGWVDWNDHFRDGVRSFWLADRAAIESGGHGGSVARLADALSGSAGLFEASGRSRLASLNLITAHDGFTLNDLVSYDRKHNEANGEQNRDGHGDNRSYNHGFEGPTEDEDILAQRAQSRRNLMASMMISLGRAHDHRPVTSWHAPSRATTTPTARTTPWPGLTGPARRNRTRCSAAPSATSGCARSSWPASRTIFRPGMSSRTCTGSTTPGSRCPWNGGMIPGTG